MKFHYIISIHCVIQGQVSNLITNSGVYTENEKGVTEEQRYNKILGIVTKKYKMEIGDAYVTFYRLVKEK